MRIFKTRIIEDQLAVDNATFADILDEARKYAHGAIVVENLSGLESITYAQIKWWKGILLSRLAIETGYSVGYWENELKLGVMPDQFQPITTTIDGHKHDHLESIKILTRGEMREMIEGSVAYLRDEKRYNKRLEKRFGPMFHWLVLPDPELRK